MSAGIWVIGVCTVVACGLIIWDWIDDGRKGK